MTSRVGPGLAASFCFLLASTTPVQAQSAPWARGTGLAGADFALARGYGAVEWNPANLFVDDSVAFSFGSEIHGGRLLVTGAGLTELADIVTAAGGGAPELVDGIPSDGLRLDSWSEGLTANHLAKALDLPDPSGGAEVPTMAFTYQRFGMVMRQQTVASALVSRELVDLAVNGFNPERIDEYAARGTYVRSFTLTSVTFAYSLRRTQRLWLGVAGRYVGGRKLLNGRVFEPEIDVDAERLSASAAAVESRGGRGVGIDLGATYRVRPNLYASFAIRNALQRMSWSGDLWVSQSTFDQEDIGSTDMRELIGRFKGRELIADGATLEASPAANGLFTESFLPRIVRAGVGYRSSMGTTLQLTGSKTLGPGALVAPRPDRLALGAEHRLGFAALRAGAAVEEGGSWEMTFGTGLRLDALQFDFAGGWTRGRGDMAGIVNGFSAAIGIGFLVEGDRIVR